MDGNDIDNDHENGQRKEYNTAPPIKTSPQSPNHHLKKVWADDVLKNGSSNFPLFLNLNKDLSVIIICLPNMQDMD